MPVVDVRPLHHNHTALATLPSIAGTFRRIASVGLGTTLRSASTADSCGTSFRSNSGSKCLIVFRECSQRVKNQPQTRAFALYGQHLSALERLKRLRSNAIVIEIC